MKHLLKILFLLWIGNVSAQTISNAYIFNNPTVITNGPLRATFGTSVSSATTQNSITFGAGTTSSSSSGTTLCWPYIFLSSPPAGSLFYTSLYYMGGGADFFECTGRTTPLFRKLMLDNTANNTGAFDIVNSTTDGPGLRVQTAASTANACPTVRTALLANGPCSMIFADNAGANAYPLTISWAHNSSQILLLSNQDIYLTGNTSSTSLQWANNTWVSSTQETLVLGDSTGASSTTAIDSQGGVSINPSINGAVNICTGSCNGTITIGNSGTTNSTVLGGLTTGTNADFLCLSAAKVVLIQASACTISTERFKTEIFPLADAVAIMNLQPVHFTMKYQGTPNGDPNFSHPQVGLTAENVATVIPDCAVYENDMKTPKSYRPECIDAFLIKIVQDHQRELWHDKAEIYLLALWCLLLSSHAGYTHWKRRS